ncbi:MAG: Xaa-Pro peptidase family protein [Synergistaceae bacterium]|jgi:Xaa-Pro aminopeptidase|nr:Xaa-Pro peptidase family protein [Synergistaceae bacterium]
MKSVFLKKRMRNMEASLAAEGLDALLILKEANQRYLEGFTGDGCFLLVSRRGNFLMADSRYVEMASHECESAQIVPHRRPHPPFEKALAGLVREHGFKKLGFEAVMPYGMYETIAAEIGKDASLKPVSSMVEKIRAHKDDGEIEETASACGIADRALMALLDAVKPGVSELDVRTELDYRLKKGGAEDAAFNTMVLFGARASQPHANSRADVKLRAGDFILIDYGASVNGYKSDTTRTFVMGSASDEQKRAYNAVLKSQIESLSMVRPGANGRELNERALGVIGEAGFPAFSYGIGHGTGLEIHEEPFMRQGSDVILSSGMVHTIEPGTYIPGWGGIRIEDTVLVTDDGHRVLTSFPKDLMEL